VQRSQLRLKAIVFAAADVGKQAAITVFAEIHWPITGLA